MIGIETMAMGLVLGLIGGAAHQLHDSEQENDYASMVRGTVIGAIAGILTVLITPAAAVTNIGYVSIFISGWFGDSVILNIVRRNTKVASINTSTGKDKNTSDKKE